MNWIPNILRRGNDGNTSPSLLDCLSLDLEVSPKDGRINALAAVRPDTEESTAFDNKGDRLDEALARLDALAENKAFVLGHNLIHFDLPRLQTINPHLRLVDMPAVDTLMLNPLAFPQNPYHYLVKHYQDGQLRRGRINDPELDARLTLEVFENQQNALRGKDADLLAAWHWLTTVDSGEGFEIVYRVLRQSRRPSDKEARTAIADRLDGSACSKSAQQVLDDAGRYGWSLAYVLAWLSVAGGNSVMPRG